MIAFSRDENPSLCRIALPLLKDFLILADIGILIFITTTLLVQTFPQMGSLLVYLWYRLMP